jgi:hypothetical protein
VTRAGPYIDVTAGGVDGAVPIDRVVVGVDAAIRLFTIYNI